jgi:hypothetical protein
VAGANVPDSDDGVAGAFATLSLLLPPTVRRTPAAPSAAVLRPYRVLVPASRFNPRERRGDTGDGV